MLDHESLAALIRRLKRAPLVNGGGVAVSHGRDAIERLVPHRGPMLLVDAIEAVDVERRAVRGRRRLAADDPGFDGHFPGDPVYPGVLVVEAIGQLGLTLLHFDAARAAVVPAGAPSRRVRAVHIHRATFLSPFVPGDTMTLHAQVVEDDAMTLVAAGQAWNGDMLAAYAVSEVYLDE